MSHLEHLLERLNRVLKPRYGCEAVYLPDDPSEEFLIPDEPFLPVTRLDQSIDGYLLLAGGNMLSAEDLIDALGLLESFVVQPLQDSEHNETLEALETVLSESPSNVVSLRKRSPEAPLWTPPKQRAIVTPILLRGENLQVLEQVALKIHEQLRNVALLRIEDLNEPTDLEMITILIRDPKSVSPEMWPKIQAGPQWIALWHSKDPVPPEWAFLYEIFRDTLQCPDTIGSDAWLTDWVDAFLFKPVPCV